MRLSRLLKLPDLSEAILPGHAVFARTNSGLAAKVAPVSNEEAPHLRRANTRDRKTMTPRDVSGILRFLLHPEIGQFSPFAPMVSAALRYVNLFSNQNLFEASLCLENYFSFQRLFFRDPPKLTFKNMHENNLARLLPTPK